MGAPSGRNLLQITFSAYHSPLRQILYVREHLFTTFSLSFNPGIAFLPCPRTLQNTTMADLSNVQSHQVLPAEAMLPGDSLQLSPVVSEKNDLGVSENVAEAGQWTYPDGGLRAWLVVLGCFIMAATCMAWGLVWGVFQDYYHTTKFAGTPLSSLSLVGGLFSFSMNCAAYLFGGIGDRYGYKVSFNKSRSSSSH
ncbi:hypothetical protein B0H12DRAFT_39627 [Mycena haematopus]|nr:hypothetical protein B0H12DRAFT_39627 [Mycena haematopus]